MPALPAHALRFIAPLIVSNGSNARTCDKGMNSTNFLFRCRVPNAAVQSRPADLKSVMKLRRDIFAKIDRKSCLIIPQVVLRKQLTK